MVNSTYLMALPGKFLLYQTPVPYITILETLTAAAEQWRKFGIDATVNATEAFNSLVLNGEFSVASQWPAAEPWGAGVDLSRTFDPWHSRLLTPIGQPIALGPGGGARWSDPRLDEIIEKLEAT